MGPSVPSDVYTIGRTLAVLTLDFRGYQRKLQHALPDPADHPVLARFDSFHRLLLKATAPHPDDRFQTVGRAGRPDGGRAAGGRGRSTTGRPQAAPSAAVRPAPPDGRPPCRRSPSTPPTRPPPSWPAWPATTPAGGRARDRRRPWPPGQVPETVEVRLRRARALHRPRRPRRRAAASSTAVERDDPWEWRAVWLRGVSALAAGDRAGRRRRPSTGAGRRSRASWRPSWRRPSRPSGPATSAGAGRPLRDRSSAVDPGYVAAARGLARCRAAPGDVAGALAAYDRIPATHRAHAGAQIDSGAHAQRGRPLRRGGRAAGRPADVDAAAARPSWRPSCTGPPSRRPRRPHAGPGRPLAAGRRRAGPAPAAWRRPCAGWPGSPPTPPSASPSSTGPTPCDR